MKAIASVSFGDLESYIRSLGFLNDEEKYGNNFHLNCRLELKVTIAFLDPKL